MAVLHDADRAELWASLMRVYSDEHTMIGITKDELRAAVNALDDFMHANAAAINNAIPQPARGVLSTRQKALVLMAVVDRRYLSGV